MLNHLTAVQKTQRVGVRRCRRVARHRDHRSLCRLILRGLAAADRSCDHRVSRVRVEVVKDNRCARRARGDPAGSRNHIAARVKQRVLGIRRGRADRDGLLTRICGICAGRSVRSDCRNRRRGRLTAVHPRNACNRRSSCRVLAGRELIDLVLRVDRKTGERTRLKRRTRKCRNHIAAHVGDGIVSECIGTAHIDRACAVVRNCAACVRHCEYTVVREANPQEVDIVGLVTADLCCRQRILSHAAGPRRCIVVGVRRRRRHIQVCPSRQMIGTACRIRRPLANGQGRETAQVTVRAVCKVNRVPFRRVLHELRVDLDRGRRTACTCRNHELMICCRNGRSIGHRVVNLLLRAVVDLDIPAFRHVVRIRIRVDSQSAAGCNADQLLPGVRADTDGARCRIAGDIAVVIALVGFARPDSRVV